MLSIRKLLKETKPKLSRYGLFTLSTLLFETIRKMTQNVQAEIKQRLFLFPLEQSAAL